MASKLILTIYAEKSRIACPSLYTAMPLPTETYKTLLMRLLMLALLACCMGEVNVAAQCPVQLGQALFDKDRKTASIRYHNASTRAAKEVQFVLSVQEPPTSGAAVVGSVSAKGIVRPGQARTLVFPYVSAAPPNGIMELEVKRVLFVDGAPWTASHNSHCKVAVEETRSPNAAR